MECVGVGEGGLSSDRRAAFVLRWLGLCDAKIISPLCSNTALEPHPLDPYSIVLLLPRPDMADGMRIRLRQRRCSAVGAKARWEGGKCEGAEGPTTLFDRPSPWPLGGCVSLRWIDNVFIIRLP